MLTNEMSRKTPVLGLRLWVVVGLAVGAAFLLLLALIAVHFAATARRRRPKPTTKQSAAPAPMSPATIPPVSKEIQEVTVQVGSLRHYLEMGAAYLKDKDKEGGGDGDSLCGSAATHGSQRVYIEAGKGRRMVACAADGAAGSVQSDAASVGGPEVSHLGWGHWYTLRELEEATAGFAPDRVVGEGGYGIVYLGVFADGHQVAVKNLLNNRSERAHLSTAHAPLVSVSSVTNLLFFGACTSQGPGGAGVHGGGGGDRPRPPQEPGPAARLLRRGSAPVHAMIHRLITD